MQVLCTQIFIGVPTCVLDKLHQINLDYVRVCHFVSGSFCAQQGHQGEEDYKYEEPTGRVVWDCARVLYDLLADPAQDNTFSVRGKASRCTL